MKQPIRRVVVGVGAAIGALLAIIVVRAAGLHYLPAFSVSAWAERIVVVSVVYTAIALCHYLAEQAIALSARAGAGIVTAPPHTDTKP